MYSYPEYYNITYNYPTLYTNRYIENRLGNQRFLANKLTKDGIYLIFDNRKKPTFDINYVDDSVRDFAKSYDRRTTIKTQLNF